MNITLTEINMWNQLNDYMLSRAYAIIRVIQDYQLDRHLRGFERITRIDISKDHNGVDIDFGTFRSGEYESDNYIGFPIEWFESECDFKAKIFEKYNYTPEED